MTDISSVLGAAELAKRLGSATTLAASGWSCQCPADEDGGASLSLGGENGRLLWHCHAGCSQDEVDEAPCGPALLPPRSSSIGANGRAALATKHERAREAELAAAAEPEPPSKPLTRVRGQRARRMP